MRVGHALLQLARAADARTLFVVGIGKNVGKTVTLRAIYEAACEAGGPPAMLSVGRDGEAADVVDARPKPQFFLRAGTPIATAAGVLPRSPACELIGLSELQTACGPLLYARVVHPGRFELVGPPTAAGVREAAEVLSRFGETILIDGAVDRLAAVAEGPGAIVVAGGAAAAGTIAEAAIAMRALVERLTVPPYDPRQDAVVVDGALTPSVAAGYIAAGERRQIVVGSPTQIALGGKAASQVFARLRIRCRQPLRVIAATVSSIGTERSFEPLALARAVAAATGLPTFDVYAAHRAA